ncbi:MAG: VOC family protein [Bacteroidetes bacterium]|nr:VOC family protein [Bacteroidota bacterium]
MKLKALTINIMSENVDRAAGFYRDTFGFEILTTVPGQDETIFAMIKRDEVSIMIQSMKSFVEANPEYKDHKVGGTVLLYMDVTAIGKWYETAKKNNCDFVKHLNKTFYGTNEFTIRDTDGYRVSFAEDETE